MNGKQLKNSILQWAIQGKLVPQDPNDEPASVLLERIRTEKAKLVKEKKIKNKVKEGTGGVGVALTMMVNGLTLDKKGFENDRERLLDAIAKGNELKERFIDVMNRDSEVFDVLIESLALPKDDDEHKAIRRGAVQASFRNCTLVPLTMMEICSEAIDLCAGLVGTTNPNVVSDLGIAALTLKTAMESAWLNVLINLSSLKDKAFRDECCQKGEALLAHAVPIAQESYEKVIKVITEK